MFLVVLFLVMLVGIIGFFAVALNCLKQVHSYHDDSCL